MSTFTNTAREVEMPNGDVVVIHNAPTGGENTTSNIKKFKYDDNGHVTESTDADAEDLNLSGYSTPTTGSTDIGTSDDVQTAIGKLDHQSQIDQTNILSTKDDVAYVLGKTGKNLINIADVTTTEEGFVIGQTYITPLAAGSYVFSYISNQEDAGDIQFKAYNGDTVLAEPTIVSKSGRNKMSFTLPSTADSISLYSIRAGTYSDFMLCTQADDDVSPDYQPYRGLPNYDLTQREQQDRNALVEVVDEGAKNIFDAQTPDYMRDTSIVPLSNGGITISCTNAIWTQYIKLISVIPNKSYRFMIYVDNISQGLQNFDVLISTNETTPVGLGEIENIHLTGAYHIDLTPATDSINVRLFLNNTETAKTQSADIRVLLCPMDKWNISQNYAPFALPNTDLTVLESEDRAALTEVVDSGAKNLINIADVSTTGSSFVFDNTSINSLPAGSYVFSYTSNQEEAGNIQLVVRNGDTVLAEPTIVSKSGRNLIPFTIPSTANTIALYSTRAGTYSDFMICTEADWKISQNFAPYRKNLDQLEATKAPALDTGAGVDSGSLDDISENTFAIYTTNVSNLPTATSYYYVETSVFNSSSALQRAYDTGNGESYVRVKYQGTWQAWKQITNA